jgi:hypothetical protein
MWECNTARCQLRQEMSERSPVNEALPDELLMTDEMAVCKSRALAAAVACETSRVCCRHTHIRHHAPMALAQWHHCAVTDTAAWTDPWQGGHTCSTGMTTCALSPVALATADAMASAVVFAMAFATACVETEPLPEDPARV